MLRTLRDTFRYSVDFGGLTADSLDAFTRHIIPALNRAVVGPQFERHAELLALLDAGIAEVPLGPAPEARWDTGRWVLTSTVLEEAVHREADWLVAAHVELPAVRGSASPLLRSMHAAGKLRPHRPNSQVVTGVDIDADQHPIDIRRHVDSRIWILGPLCEGATFYNNLVPSPGVRSRPIVDAHRCVAELLGLGYDSHHAAAG